MCVFCSLPLLPSLPEASRKRTETMLAGPGLANTQAEQSRPFVLGLVLLIIFLSLQSVRAPREALTLPAHLHASGQRRT